MGDMRGSSLFANLIASLATIKKSPTMVSKLVAAVVVPFALVFAAPPAPHVPHHPAPYHHPDPYHPAPHGYCDPKAPPACALDSDLPYCVVDPEYPEYEVANKISQDPIFLKKIFRCGRPIC